jgi:CubicO group peptidase (beta-lactamase class C family)
MDAAIDCGDVIATRWARKRACKHALRNAHNFPLSLPVTTNTPELAAAGSFRDNGAGGIAMKRRHFLAAAAACSLVPASAGRARAQTRAGFAAAARYSAERGGVSLVVARHGIVLAEDYPNSGGPQQRWPIGEGTRAFAPLLAASLIDDAIVRLDDPIALTLWEWAAHPVKNTITLRALLGGVSGLAFAARDRRDLATALALEPREAPGLSFSTDSAPYLLLAEIARRKLEARNLEADAARYLTARTLAPIGCVPIGWTRWPSGAARLDDGCAVTARGWAQVGELIRREGVWRGQQLVNDVTLRDAQRGSFAEARAGFGLWLAAPASQNARGRLDVDSDLWRTSSPAPIDLAMAAGEGGQRLYLSRTEGLVIVRQAQGRERWSDAEFLSLLWADL